MAPVKGATEFLLACGFENKVLLVEGATSTLLNIVLVSNSSLLSLGRTCKLIPPPWYEESVNGPP